MINQGDKALITLAVAVGVPCAAIIAICTFALLIGG